MSYADSNGATSQAQATQMSNDELRRQVAALQEVARAAEAVRCDIKAIVDNLDSFGSKARMAISTTYARQEWHDRLERALDGLEEDRC